MVEWNLWVMVVVFGWGSPGEGSDGIMRGRSEISKE